MSNGKSYMPKILTFNAGPSLDFQTMEDELAQYTLNGWKIASMSHFQHKEPTYTVLLQYEFSEEEMKQQREKRA